jgi:hypothetical protein
LIPPELIFVLQIPEEVMKQVILALPVLVCSLAAVGSLTLFRRFHWPAPGLWILKLVISACSPWFILIGTAGAGLALITHSAIPAGIGTYVAVIFFIHWIRVTRAPRSPGLEPAFGMHRENAIGQEQKKFFIHSRRALNLPAVPEPRLEQKYSIRNPSWRRPNTVL